MTVKKVIFIAFLSFLTLCCSTDDEVPQIIGRWKLLEARYYGFQGESTIDYSNNNIIYSFQANDILVVSGGDNAGYANGEYQYFYGEGYLGDLAEGKPILIVEINDTKWEFDLSNGKMTLGQAYVDGPNLLFQRR